MVFADLNIHFSFGLNSEIYFEINMNVLKNERIGIKREKFQRLTLSNPH